MAEHLLTFPVRYDRWIRHVLVMRDQKYVGIFIDHKAYFYSVAGIILYQEISCDTLNLDTIGAALPSRQHDRYEVYGPNRGHESSTSRSLGGSEYHRKTLSGLANQIREPCCIM
jgi:hypothetical protein